MIEVREKGFGEGEFKQSSKTLTDTTAKSDLDEDACTGRFSTGIW